MFLSASYHIVRVPEIWWAVIQCYLVWSCMWFARGRRFLAVDYLTWNFFQIKWRISANSWWHWSLKTKDFKTNLSVFMNVILRFLKPGYWTSRHQVSYRFMTVGSVFIWFASVVVKQTRRLWDVFWWSLLVRVRSVSLGFVCNSVFHCYRWLVEQLMLSFHTIPIPMRHPNDAVQQALKFEIEFEHDLSPMHENVVSCSKITVLG